MDEEILRMRLHQEINRLSSIKLRNFQRNENSFWAWLNRTVRRIWNAVMDSWIVETGKWLWHVLFG